MTPIDFWFSIGSTYSYLTVSRLKLYADETGADVTWRPFNVRQIMRAQNNIPFADKPAKLAYMWRDIARRAGLYGLSPQLPASYPLDELERANRVALVAAEEGWVEAYVREAYRLWFEQGQPAGSEPNLSASIRASRQDPERVLPLADGAASRRALAFVTDHARDLGIFGAPSFAVAGEIFWGDDRLDDAIAWAKHGSLGPAG